jgi:hypothetical protein
MKASETMFRAASPKSYQDYPAGEAKSVFKIHFP